MKYPMRRKPVALLLLLAMLLCLFTACTEDLTSSAPSSDTSPDTISSGIVTSVPGSSSSVPASSEDPSSAPPPSSQAPSSVPAAPVLTGLEVHFIDVGQADAALVLCEGKAMLIDGGNVADSNLIYAYLKKCSVAHLDYIVCTHAHEDHVGGLSGALNYATVGTAYAPVTSYDSDAFRNFVKNLSKRGKSITVPSAGQTFSMGNAKITIVGPVRTSDEPNNTSIVLRLVYGETSFLFTGDAELDEERDILDRGYALESTVLKVGHHGSETSTSYRFLREIMPDYAVISVGKGNSYGHPTDAVLSRLRDAEVKVYRTDLQGDVICKSDGKTVSFTVDRNANADTLIPGGSSVASKPSSSAPASSKPSSSSSRVESQPAETRTYVLNTNTKKFHSPSCRHVKSIAAKNYAEFTGTRAQVITRGYSPCGTCKP
jgi:competence protein ComEC